MKSSSAPLEPIPARGSIRDGIFGKVKTFYTLRAYPSFRFLWINQALYQLGWWAMLLVMSWVVYELTNSPFLVSVFTAARLSPSLLAPIAGAVGDRVNRKKFIALGTVVQAFLTGILAILIATGGIQFWHLVVIGFLEGMTQRLCYTTAYALTADIVKEEDLANAVALKVVAMDITRVVGPAAGGILIGTLGAANSSWIAAGMFVVSIFAILGVRYQPRTRTAHQRQSSVWRDLADGFLYIVHHRDMLAILAITISYNIFLAPIHQALLPVFAKDIFKQGAEGFGFLNTAMGAGALIGALIIASLGNFRWKGLLYLGGTWLCALFFIAFGLSRAFPIGLALIAFAGAAGAGFGTMQATLMLKLAPEDMRARCMGFQNMAIGIYTFGALGIGAVAEAIGASLATAISAGILSVLIIAIAIGLPSLRRL